MPIVNPTEYIHSCVNKGECTRVKLEREGIYFPKFFVVKGVEHTYFANGKNYVAIGNPEQVRQAFFSKSMRFDFPCCCGCKMPATTFDAIDLNKKLGLVIPTLEESMSFMDKALEGFDLFD